MAQFQHYVPQFYLNGWQTVADFKGRRIWIYERGTKPRHGPIKGSVGEDNYYEIKSFDGSSDIVSVEQFLSNGEGKAGRAFVKIRKGDALTAEERDDFAEFLSALIGRTPYWRARAAKIVEKELPKITESLLEVAERAEDENRRARLRANVESAAASVLTRRASVVAASLLKDSDIPQRIAGMDWGFLYHSKLKFLTSDNPVVYSPGIGIGDFENGHIIFPITSCLSFQAKNSSKFNNSYHEISDDLLREINLRIVRHAYKQVYADEHSSEIEQLVEKNIAADLTELPGQPSFET